MADRNEIDCPRAKSWMTPCVARDGSTACTDPPGCVCVGCGAAPAALLADLAERYEPARRYWKSRRQSHGPGVADRLATLVAEYVEAKP